MTEKDSNVEESVLEVEQASQVELDSEQISPAEKESVLAEEKGLSTDVSTDVDIPEMTAPDDEKSAFFEQWKARHQAAIKPTLLIKMLRKFRQLTRDRQNRRTQKLKRVKGSFFRE
ncbi:hypothetical protein [Streptococcus suis]